LIYILYPLTYYITIYFFLIILTNLLNDICIFKQKIEQESLTINS